MRMYEDLLSLNLSSRQVNLHCISHSNGLLTIHRLTNDYHRQPLKTIITIMVHGTTIDHFIVLKVLPSAVFLARGCFVIWRGWMVEQAIDHNFQSKCQNINFRISNDTFQIPVLDNLVKISKKYVQFDIGWFGKFQPENDPTCL